MEPIENIHLNTLCYRLDKTVGEFSIEIRKILADNLGDGYSVDLNEFEGVAFTRIEIFGRNTYSFIKNYLESNGVEIDYPIIPVNQDNALIQINGFDKSLTQELINELVIKFGPEVRITHSERIFEKGASDWSLDLLLWLGNIPVSIIATYIYDYLKKKQLNSCNELNVIENCNIDNILSVASEISGKNKNDLKIIKFSYSEYDNTTFYFITSRHIDIQLTLNYSGEVIGYNLDKKTQSQI